MKRSRLLSTLILLLAGHCFASGATFQEKHECLPFGLRDSICRLAWGDTVSEDVAAVYGSWRGHKAEFVKANPTLASHLDKVRAGQPVVFPNVTLNSRTAAPVPAIAETNPAREPQIQPEEIATTTIRLSGTPVPAPGAAVVAETALPSPPALLPTNDKSATEKTKHLTGYQVVLPHSRVYRVDGAPLIPIGLNLPTQIGIFSNADDPANGIEPARIINTTARVVVRKNKEAVLTVLLPQNLPTQTYVVRVSGIGGIGGKEFTSRAEPFYGHLPHQHHLFGTLLTGGSFVGSGFMLSGLLGNPVNGFAAAAGLWGTRWTIHHVRMAVLRRAEAKYQARVNKDRRLLLAEQQTTQKEQKNAE